MSDLSDLLKGNSDDTRTKLKKLIVTLIERLGDDEFDLVTQTITNGVTTSAPSENAVYDALALKEDASAVAADARAACVAQTITNGTTTSAPSQDAVYDALALKADASALSGKQDADAQLTSIAGLSFTGNALKAIRVNAGETGFEFYTP